MNPSFATRHPSWFVALLEVAVVLAYLLAGTVAHLLRLPNAAIYGLANLGLALLVALLLTRMGWWRTVGLRREMPRDLRYFALPFLPMLVNMVPGVDLRSFAFVLGMLAIALLVGFVEEGVFRGLMLRALLPRGPWTAVVATAVLFGLTHALNVLAGKSPVDDAAQVCYALAVGFAFAAVALRTGFLWPLVVAHGLIDFASYVQADVTYPAGLDLAIVAAMTAVFAGYGLFLMRRPPEAITGAVPAGAG